MCCTLTRHQLDSILCVWTDGLVDLQIQYFQKSWILKLLTKQTPHCGWRKPKCSQLRLRINSFVGNLKKHLYLLSLPKCWYAFQPSVRMWEPRATLSKIIRSRVARSRFLHSTKNNSCVSRHTPPRIQACLRPVIRPRLYFLHCIQSHKNENNIQNEKNLILAKATMSRWF